MFLILYITLSLIPSPPVHKSVLCLFLCCCPVNKFFSTVFFFFLDSMYMLWKWKWKLLSSVQFSPSVMSDSLWPHELQHTRPPWPSPTPRFHPNPCPLCWWRHSTISSSVIPFSYFSQSLPASGSFQMSQLSASGGQSMGVSASTSVPPMNTQDWSPLGWTGWISLQFKGLSRVFSNPHFKSINSSTLSFLHSPTLTSIHDHWKNHSLD